MLLLRYCTNAIAVTMSHNMLVRFVKGAEIGNFGAKKDMTEQVKQQGMDVQDQIYGRDAVDMARTLNANIGIVAYGKAFYFYKGLLEEMQKKSGQTINLGHLVELCREEGKEVGLCNSRCFVTLNALDITEELWLNELEEMGNDYGDDCEDGDDGDDGEEELEDEL